MLNSSYQFLEKIRILAEVNNFIEVYISPLLFATVTASEETRPKAQAINDALDQWYYYSVEYISKTFSTFNKILGNILHAALLGNSIIVENDAEATSALSRLIFSISFLFSRIKFLTANFWE